MTAPIDTLTGVQDAIVKMLRDQLPDGQKGLARHSLKQGALPPFHLVGDIDIEGEGGKGEQFDRATVDVQTAYRGLDRGELLAMMFQVRLAAQDTPIEIEGVQYRATWLSAAASTAASDGVTFAGITTIEITAEPA